MHLFIKDSIFHNFWPNLSAQILRYFLNFRKCAYESLLQHRNILRKSEKRFCEVLRIRCTFSLKIQFFIMFDLTLAQILRYFLNFRKCAYESLLQHRNILRKSEKLFYEVLRIRCTFSLKIQFFIMFDLTLAQILRYFLNFRKCAYESLPKKRKTVMSIVISCENFERANALMNHFWVILQKSVKRFWIGPDAPFH